jgi:hypothetical protein
MSTELTPDVSIFSMHLHEASITKPPLLNLPVELQELIIENLLPADFPAKFNLRTTCHYFYSLIKRPTHKELLAAEKSPYAYTKKLFTCGDCLRLLPESKFEAYMLSSRPKDGCAWDRLCIECGNKYPLWGERRGELKFDAPQQTHLGEDWGICIQCGRLVMAHILTDRAIATNEAIPMTNCYCNACLRWVLSRTRVECTLSFSRAIGSTIPRPSSTASSDEEFSGAYQVLEPRLKLVWCIRRLLCLGNRY